MVVYQEYIIIKSNLSKEMKNDISCVFEGIDNNGAIYISGIHAAEDIDILKDKHIKAVLTVARGGKLSHSTDHIKHYLYVPADDHEQYDLAQFFTRSFEFIEKARRETNVLIHCMAGISRSATITAAYLIMKFGYEMNTVLNLLKRKRSKISPNPGFLIQLSQISSKSRTVSKSVENKLESFQSAFLPSSKKEISCSLKKVDNKSEMTTSKYLANYSSNRTPVRSKKTNGTLEPKNSNKKQKIQLKIDRVKKTLFSQMVSSQVPENTENFFSICLKI